MSPQHFLISRPLIKSLSQREALLKSVSPKTLCYSSHTHSDESFQSSDIECLLPSNFVDRKPHETGISMGEQKMLASLDLVSLLTCHKRSPKFRKREKKRGVVCYGEVSSLVCHGDSFVSARKEKKTVQETQTHFIFTRKRTPQIRKELEKQVKYRLCPVWGHTMGKSLVFSFCFVSWCDQKG